MSETIVIDRVRGISGADLYRNYVEPKRPVIIEDACAAWPALGVNKWTLDGLRQRFGDRRFQLDPDREVGVGELLTTIEKSTPDAPAPYLRHCYLSQTLKELLADVSPLPGDEHNRLNASCLPGMGKLRRDGSPELLVAGRGAHFPVLHYDVYHFHAFITQIRGAKTFWLYRPDQGQYLYPREDAPNASRIDRFDPVDLNRWPDYAKAKSVSVEVKPGETIFVPSGFWHRTHVSDLSIALTWNSVSRCNWHDFVKDRYLQWSKQSRLKHEMKRLYFRALGFGLSFRDA